MAACMMATTARRIIVAGLPPGVRTMVQQCLFPCRRIILRHCRVGGPDIQSQNCASAQITSRVMTCFNPQGSYDSYLSPLTRALLNGPIKEFRESDESDAFPARSTAEAGRDHEFRPRLDASRWPPSESSESKSCMNRGACAPQSAAA